MSQFDQVLPAPECKDGYPLGQLRTILGDRRLADFHEWFVGQTGSICEGREWDHETRSYVETDCGPHGAVVYVDDVKRFLSGRRPID